MNRIVYKTAQSSINPRSDTPLSVHYHDKPTVPAQKPSLAVLCDFDGTITLNDTFEQILKKYATGDWKVFDQQYARGEISLQECLRKQGALVRTPEMVLIAELERVTTFRPNFGRLVTYCRSNRVPLAIVSAGLDFAIKHLLRMKGWDNLVKLYVAKSEMTPSGIKFTFPRLQNKTSLSVKDDLVKRYKGQGRKVVYVGDGIWDMDALKQSDYRYDMMFKKGRKSPTWNWTETRFAKSHNYWLATTRPDGRPHVMPIWGVLLNNTFHFSTGPQSRKGRNIAKNPNCVVCTEDAAEVI